MKAKRDSLPTSCQLATPAATAAMHAHSPVFAPTPKDDFHKKVTEQDLAWKLDEHPDWFMSSSFITVGKVRQISVCW